MTARDDAERFGELFAALFHRYHRSDPVVGWRPSPEALALLDHLSRTGPLTVELLQRLERRGLLERRRDERDRRRTLVWLSEVGLETWRESRRVLDLDRLTAALERRSAAQRKQLIEGLAELLETRPPFRDDPPGGTR